jgi:tetratricopeptide (TPR) repeat protein
MARLLLEHKADPHAMFLTWASTPRNCLEYLRNQNLENTSLYQLLLDYGAELPTYIKMVEKYPEKAGYIAEAVVSAERFDDAITLTTYLIEKRPTSTLHYQRGVAYDMTGNPVAALADFDAAIALDAGNFQALYSRALVRRKLGHWRESVADLEAAHQVNPSDYYTLNALARALLEPPHDVTRDSAASTVACMRAVQLANEACALSEWNNAICIATLAQAYRKTGDESKAAEWDRKAAELREG